MFSSERDVCIRFKYIRITTDMKQVKEFFICYKLNSVGNIFWDLKSKYINIVKLGMTNVKKLKYLRVFKK